MPGNVRPWSYKYVYTHVHNMDTARRNTCNIEYGNFLARCTTTLRRSIWSLQLISGRQIAKVPTNCVWRHRYRDTAKFSYHGYQNFNVLISRQKRCFSCRNNNNNNNNNNKYQELANEIYATWKQKAAQVIPIVISSTGVIPKSLSQSLTRLNLHPNTYMQLQKSVILGTCSIVRNFLNYK